MQVFATCAAFIGSWIITMVLGTALLVLADIGMPWTALVGLLEGSDYLVPDAQLGDTLLLAVVIDAVAITLVKVNTTLPFQSHSTFNLLF